jgi:hypothetical protein
MTAITNNILDNINTLTFTNSEIVPSDLEHLRALINKGNDPTGLIAFLIEKLEGVFAESKYKLAQQVQESSYVTIDGSKLRIIGRNAKQCQIGAENLCLYTVNVDTSAEDVFTFDDLYDFLTEDNIYFEKT